MAEATLSEEVKRRKAAEAIAAADDDGTDTEEDSAADEAPSADAETSEPESANKEEPAEPAVTEEGSDVSPAVTAPNQGYVFAPITAPAKAAQSAPSSAAPATAAADKGQRFLNPATGNYEELTYEAPEGGRYVIDQDSGQMVPRGELATAADKAAQPPGGTVLPKVDVTAQAPTEPAPDTLSQVERGELVKAPPGTAPKALPVPGQNYVFKPIAEQPPAGQAPQKPAQQTTQGPASGIAPLTPDQIREPGIDIYSNGYSQGRGNQSVRNVVLHSTDGEGKGDINRLTQSGEVGVHYYVTRDGQVHHFVSDADSAWQAGKDKYGNNANPYTIGIEQEHYDPGPDVPKQYQASGQDWPDAQVQATAKTVAAILLRNPQLSVDDVVGHSDIAGERKQDPVNYPWAKFHQYVAAYMGQGGGPSQVAGAPQAQPATKQANGLYQSEKPEEFLTGKATTFATPSDIATGQDNGVGAPRLGRLDTTQVSGVAIPEEALLAKYGTNYAAWRRARVDVVDPQTGKRLRVPIVDLGPRGDLSAITDMTPRLSSYFGGDRNLMVKIVDNAGPDVTKNPQLFADEQAALAQGFDSSALQPGAVKVQKPQGYQFKPVSGAQSAAMAQADAFNQQNQRQALQDLNDQSSSPVELYKRLDKPVEGVSDPMRKEFQGELKKEITTYAQDFYGEKDPDAAFKKATSDASFGTVAAEAFRKIPAAYGQLDVALNEAAQSIDSNRLDQFARVLHPEATPEGRAAFIKGITTDIQDPDVRSKAIGNLIHELEMKDPAKAAALDSVAIADSADRVADPQYQKAQQTAIDVKKAWINKQLRDDPRLQGTLGAFIADQGAQFLPNVTMALLPPGIRESAFAAQIYSQAKDEFKRDHPDWTEAQLNDAAGKSAVMQLAPQEIVSAAIGGKLGALTGGIANPLARIGTTALSHVGIGAGGAVWQQIAANLAAGKDPYEGIPQAALAGVIQSLPGGIAAGVMHPGPERAITARPAEPPVREEAPPTEEARPTEEVAPPLEEPRPVPPPVEERPPIEEPKEEPVPVDESKQADVEDNLNRQNEALDKRYDTEQKLTPIEEKPVPADLTEREPQRPTDEPQRADLVPQPVREDLGEREELPPVRREPVEREATVQPQLGRVPGALETKLSDSERAAFKPELDALERAPLNGASPQFQQAYRALREKVISRFQPLLDAMGVTRKPDNVGEHFAAGLNSDGTLALSTHLEKGADVLAKQIAAGVNPLDYLHSVVQEELAHFAKHLVTRDEYSAAGGDKKFGPKGLWRFQYAEHRRILEDAIRARDEARAKGQTRLANDLEDALHSSLPLYHIRGEELSREQMESELQALRTNPDPNILNNAVHELVRQMVQIRSGNPLSESYFARAWEAARGWYIKALDGLKRLAARLGSGRTLAKLELSRAVRAVELKLAQMDRAVEHESQLQSYRGESDEDLRAAVKFNKDPFAIKVLEERELERQAQMQHQAQMQSEAEQPSGREHLLQAISRAGGLPNPQRMRSLAAKGETMTGEFNRVYDAWRALPLEVKKELGREGVTHNKLFRADAEPLDIFRGNLAQHPEGYSYGTTGELLAETERALAMARQGRRVYGQGFGPEAPREPEDFALEMQRARAGGRRFKPAKAIAKPMEFKWDQPEAFRLEQETTGGAPAPPKPAPAEERTGDLFGPAAPSIKGLGEAIRKAKASFGLALKSGESSMLDYEETRNLARAIRRKPSLVQAYGQRARLNQLVDAFESIPRGERARVKQEFSDYTKAEQMKQPLPAIGADTMRLINAGKNTLEGFGQISKELNVHVRDSEGRVRPMRVIGRDYYPRMISADVRDIFNNRDGSRAADFDALVNRQIARGVVKDRQEFIDKFTHAISGEPYSNDHFSNLERARETQLPLDFYDFSPEALVKYAGRAGDRLAQIGAFGQKLSEKGKDIFDLAIQKVNQSGSLSHQAKEALINRIASERQAQYSAGPVSGLERLGSLGRNVASGLYLSNWQTAFRNLVTGAAQNMVFGGPSSFIKTAAQFPFQWRKIITEARDRNLFRANLRNVLDDYDLATNPNWWERGGRWMADKALKYGGHNLTEAINRSFAMQQGKQILRDFVRDYGVNDNTVSRNRTEFVKRRFGFRHDEDASRTLTALAREGGVGPLTDEFLRQHVMDVHANYGPGQSPAGLLNNPAGKMLFQFQRWGANATRMMTREYIMPLTRAFQSGSYADKGYHALRTLGFLAAGTGVGGAFQAAINALYHRDPKDATLAEIGKMLSQGDYGSAFSYGIQKAFGLMLLSGFSGLFGDYAGMIQEHMGKDPGGRFKDPLHPPAYSIVEPFMALYQGWRGEGGATPSPKLMDDFLKNLSSTYRVGKQMALGVATSAGIKMPVVDEYRAENDRNFARQRIQMYEAQNPALQQKAEAKGTQQTTVAMAGRSPFSPVRDRIINGLLSGNAEEANSAIRDWLTKVPLEERAAEYKKIKQNINSNTPLKVGGSSKPEAVLEFLSWAKDNLPEGEARRIFSVASTYAKTALETGLEDKSKPMHMLSRIDYDKFQTPKGASPQRQAAAKAKATAQGRMVMQELVRRQKIAAQLQNR